MRIKEEYYNRKEAYDGKSGWLKGGMLAKACSWDLQLDDVEKRLRTTPPSPYPSHQVLVEQDTTYIELVFQEHKLCTNLLRG